MENMQYAEGLVKEFLIFRGFTSTLQAFESELSTEMGRNFQVDKIMDLIFSVYVPKYQAEKLIRLLSFFKQCFSSSSETVFISTLLKLEISVLQFYIVHALQSGRQDKVVELFGANGNYLLQKREDWLPWFAIPYLKNPSLDPQFRVYFTKEWQDALLLAFGNFLSEVFNGTRIPSLLKISTEKNRVKNLKHDIKQLNNKLSQLQALLEMKEAEILNLKSLAASAIQTSPSQDTKPTTGQVSLSEEGAATQNEDLDKKSNPASLHISEKVPQGSTVDNLVSADAVEAKTQTPSRLDESGDAIQPYQSESIKDVLKEEEFPEVTVDFQETFLGHTSPITRCRFSASGTNIASSFVDGTVRSNRLLLIGTADGGIKAWNADSKRVVCDLNTTMEYPSVLDLKCSPVDPLFVSAAASRRNGVSRLDKMGFASLTVWSMKTWKAMTVLPLGEDPPAITSLCFNHNGKILAASATDGMIHMFDMSAGLQITGWPAHDSAICSVLFGPDETSIFSLGSDGKIFEWSLHNQGQVLWSRDCSRFCSQESLNMCRHEMALDYNGRRMLVTSGLVRSPIYQVQGHTSGLRTLPHSAAITSVDWHPTRPIYITGSADHSVRVTSII